MLGPGYLYLVPLKPKSVAEIVAYCRVVDRKKPATIVPKVCYIGDSPQRTQ